MGETMADRSSEVRYLREKAKQFRQLGTDNKTELSARLLEIAAELDARADQLEKSG
jgi:hypothetical protein